MTRVGEVDWPSARTALGQATTQVAELLRSVPDPEVMALGEWNVAQLATHLSQAFDLVPSLARRDRGSPLRALDELGGLTIGLVDGEAERDLGVLAGRIESRSKDFLDASGAGSGDDPCPWIVAGTALPLRVLTCHLLNEAVVHGYDIAKAAGRPWVIDPAHAALILEGFIVQVMQVVGPRDLVVQEAAAGRRCRYDIRLRGGGRFGLLFDDGALTVEPPSDREVDCHLSADPAAFLLVGWGRINQWRAIPKGQLLAWGRRPWMALRLRSMLASP